MPEKVMLAVDGGAASAVALEWTLAYARHTRVDVRLATIDESPLPEGNPSARLEAVRALGQAAGRLTDVTPRSRIEMVTRHGGVVDVLATESRTADLIVIGSDRVGPLAGVFSATLPLRLAPRTKCPVIVVPVGCRLGSGPGVVGVGEASAAARAFATNEAQRTGWTPVLVRAWVPAPTGAGRSWPNPSTRHSGR
jgi:nucleotide-binding universal stress UspA family protein